VNFNILFKFIKIRKKFVEELVHIWLHS